MKETKRGERTKEKTGGLHGFDLRWAAATAAMLALMVAAAFLCSAPLRQTAYQPGETPSLEEWSQQPLDLNTASKEQLCQLPGIGEVKAQAILEHREQNGPFTSTEQLLQVPGISQNTLDRLAGLIGIA